LPQVPEPLSRIIETPPTEIYAATGERIMLIGGREVVPLNRVSHLFIQAVTATEDHRFWEHHGFDKLRTVKAFWVTLGRPSNRLHHHPAAGQESVLQLSHLCASSVSCSWPQIESCLETGVSGLHQQIPFGSAPTAWATSQVFSASPCS
jgi:hypothetical protein